MRAAMTEDEVRQRIAERERLLTELGRLLIEELGVREAPERLDPDAPLFGSGLGLDSVDAVELVVALEARFGVRPPDGLETRASLRSLGGMADLVLALRAAKEAT